jgi:hypothetical protein
VLYHGTAPQAHPPTVHREAHSLRRL